ncbi:MAG: hypothetical protein ACOCRO_06130, partial [Halanaerobiales bacterium]
MFNGKTYIPFVSEDYADKLKNKYGINITNPVTNMPSLTVRNYDKTSVDKGKSFDPFNFSADEMKTNREFLNNINQSQGAFSSSKFDIFRTAQTHLYKSDPHSAISNLMKAYETDNARFAFFDTETLGNIDEKGMGMFSITEVKFDVGTYNNLGEFNLNKNLSRNMLIAPSSTVEENIRNMLNETANKISSGKSVSLTSHETRTIKDLFKYSDGVQIKNGELIQHSQAYTKYVRGDSINLTSADPVRKAIEGLNNWTKFGVNNKDAAKRIMDYTENQLMNGNTFFAGHNISTFDFKAFNKFFKKSGFDFNFNPTNVIDTYEIGKVIFPSSLSIGRVLNNQNYIKNAASLSRGYSTLYGYSKILGYDVENIDWHRAGADVEQNYKIAGDLFFSDEAKHLIKRKVLNKNSSNNMDFNLGSFFDTSALNPGDTI